MEEIINNIISKFGVLTPNLTLSAIIIVLLIYILKDTIVEKFKSVEWLKLFSLNGKNKTSSVNILFDNLNHHDIFNVIEEVRLTIKHHEFSNDPTKTKVFHDFIGIMLNEIKFGMKRIIVTTAVFNKKTDTSNDELKQHVLQSLNIIVDKYCENGKQHLLNKGVSLANAEYIIDLFEEWRTETRLGINSRISSVFASSFYPDNFSRLLAVFEIISVSISLIPKDGVRSFEDMNGKFKTIKYN